MQVGLIIFNYTNVLFDWNENRKERKLDRIKREKNEYVKENTFLKIEFERNENWKERK